MRRGVGAAGLRKKQQERERKAQLGSKLEDENLAHIGASITTFKTNLEAFAAKYKAQINSDPVFRAQVRAPPRYLQAGQVANPVLARTQPCHPSHASLCAR